MYDHHRSHGFSVEDIARAEIGQSFAVIGTTGPTAWWMMYHIFSDREVLADVRGELDGLVKVTSDGAGEVCEINLACIRTRCPILLSTFKETLRHRSLGTAVRICLEDHMLDGRFLLKKGGIVIIPQLVQHTSVSAWGADADKFDHLRFVKGASGKKVNHTAFRAFGGGHTLCPGRHFSTTEMMAFVALMVLQYDIVPLGDGKDSVGKWKEPTWKKSPVVATFPVPDEDFKVRMLPRDSRRWKIKFEGESGGAKAMEITEEDIKHL
jgi:cytochrome P450